MERLNPEARPQEELAKRLDRALAELSALAVRVAVLEARLDAKEDDRK